MGLMDIFRRKAVATDNGNRNPRHQFGTGYTSAIMAARASYISGGSDVAELTSAAQACVSLWEGVLSGADITGTDILDRATMALVARSLALRGEFVGIIGETIIPASDWDVSTRGGQAGCIPCEHPRGGRRAHRHGACGRGSAYQDRQRPRGTLDRHGTLAAVGTVGKPVARGRGRTARHVPGCAHRFAGSTPAR